MTNKPDWLWSIMTTKRLTHMQRVIGWHLCFVSNDDGFVPYSISEMAKRIGFIGRRNLQRAIPILRYTGYLDDMTGPKTKVEDLDRRFRISERYREVGRPRCGREEMRI